MFKSKLSRQWDIFLMLVSENDHERKFLERILLKQMKKITNYNKKIISSITNEHRNRLKKNRTLIIKKRENLESEDDKKSQNQGKSLIQRIFEKKIEKDSDDSSDSDSDSDKKSKKSKKDYKLKDSQSEEEYFTPLINLKKKKRVKFHTYLNETGTFIKKNVKLDHTFYDDLNYGDMAFKFKNSEIEIDYNFKPKYVKIVHCMKFFIDKINITNQLKEITRRFLNDEKIAFFNALWFFSTDFYAKRIPGKLYEENKKNKKSLFSLQEEKRFITIVDGEIKTTDGFVLEQKTDSQNFFEFTDVIKQWKVKNEQDFQQIQKEKLIYKEKVFIKFLKVILQQENKQNKSEEIEEMFMKAMKKGLENANRSVFGKSEINLRSKTVDFNLKKDSPEIHNLKKSLKDLDLFDVNPDFLKFRQKSKIIENHYEILIRKILINKMNQLGLVTRSFNSSDFNYIFLVVKIQENTLSERAELEKMSKQFELGIVDLISFDPLDSKNRPFRIKKPNFEEYEKEKSKIDAQVFDRYQSSAKTNFDSLKANGGNPVLLSKLIKNIEDYTVYDMFNLVNINLINFKGIIDKVLKRSKNNLITNRIIQDNTSKRKEWIAFTVYTLLFTYYMRGIKKLSQYECFSKYEGLIYRLIAIKALRDTNMGYSRRNSLKFYKGQNYYVKSLWNELGLADSFAPYANYNGNKRFTDFWRRFEINELGERSVFLQKERIEILLRFLIKAVKLDDLVKKGIISEYFPLHCKFMMFGKPKLPLFVHILDIESLFKRIDNFQEREIKKFLGIMKDNAEESDFLEQSLMEDIKLNARYPWHISIDPIRDYFGEKIGIYFSLLTFYAKAKVYMSIIGLIIYVLQQHFLTNEQIVSYKYATIVFAGLVLFWSISFTELWKRRQALFAIRYG